MYHTLGDHLVRVDQSGDERLETLFTKMREGGSEGFTDTERDAAATLSGLGFIVPRDTEEQRMFEGWYRNVFQRSMNSFAATILTTMSCNLSCTYCYEQTRLSPREFMDMRAAEQVSAWLLRRIAKDGIKRMNVVFFGGEPLLNCQPIEFIGSTLREHCVAQGIAWKAGVITNGTLLTGEVARDLKRAGVSWAKVTIDGDGEAHDRLRMYHNGRGSFARIMDNIAEASRELKLVIGGNIDESNVDSVPALLDRLAASPWKDAIMAVRFKPIASFKSREMPLSKVACQLSAFTERDVGWMIELRDEIRRRGLPVVSDPNVGPCDFFRPNAVAIGIDGAIYPCGAFVGMPEFAVGHVGSDEPTPFGRYVAGLKAWGEECRECSYLPVCAGGCRVPAYLEKGDLTATVCDKRFYEAMVPRFVASCDENNRRGDMPASMFI